MLKELDFLILLEETIKKDEVSKEWVLNQVTLRKNEILLKREKEQGPKTLMGNLISALVLAGFKLQNGGFEGEDHNWVGIVQETNKPSEVVVNICFKDDAETITQIKVFETPIKRVIDDDNSVQII